MSFTNYTSIEPFVSSKFDDLKNEFDKYVVNDGTRLEKDALQTKMQDINTIINTLDTSFNNHIHFLNKEIESLNTSNETKNANLDILRDNNEILQSKYKNNLVSSLAAKASFKNERNFYRKTLVQTGIHIFSVFFSSYLIYKALKT